MTTTPALVCRNLTLRYGDTVVLQGFDLEIAPGETVALLGPSGSGKTSLLYAIAGLLEPAAGEIEVGGEIMTSTGHSVPPERRSIGMVFQNYALWPHLTAAQTVAYPLERRGVPSAEANDTARALLRRLAILELADRLPDQMSGGQQQRVGLARALAVRPTLYLFDEPTAHLDAGLRDDLQHELVTQSDAAALYTTHDAAEALAVADRVAILRDGRIAQIDTPEHVYRQPCDRWVARLTGSVSILSATVVTNAGGVVEVSVAGGAARVRGGSQIVDEKVSVVVRPEWARCDGPIAGVITLVRYEGPHTDYTVETAAGPVQVREAGEPRRGIGDRPGLALSDGWIPPTS